MKQLGRLGPAKRLQKKRGDEMSDTANKSDTEKLLTLADTISREIYGDPEAWQAIPWPEFVRDVESSLALARTV
jgi:hypothetical protein